MLEVIGAVLLVAAVVIFGLAMLWDGGIITVIGVILAGACFFGVFLVEDKISASDKFEYTYGIVEQIHGDTALTIKLDNSEVLTEAVQDTAQFDVDGYYHFVFKNGVLSKAFKEVEGI